MESRENPLLADGSPCHSEPKTAIWSQIYNWFLIVVSGSRCFQRSVDGLRRIAWMPSSWKALVPSGAVVIVQQTVCSMRIDMSMRQWVWDDSRDAGIILLDFESSRRAWRVPGFQEVSKNVRKVLEVIWACGFWHVSFSIKIPDKGISLIVFWTMQSEQFYQDRYGQCWYWKWDLLVNVGHSKCTRSLCLVAAAIWNQACK